MKIVNRKLLWKKIIIIIFFLSTFYFKTNRVHLEEANSVSLKIPYCESWIGSHNDRNCYALGLSRNKKCWIFLYTNIRCNVFILFLFYIYYTYHTEFCSPTNNFTFSRCITWVFTILTLQFLMRDENHSYLSSLDLLLQLLYITFAW